MKHHDTFIQRAIQLAEDNVNAGGWPFSAIIVKDNQILAEAINGVQTSHDPSDHAEIAAIRKATSKIQTPDLSDCTMYLMGPPCPMCMTCIRLSKLSHMVYAVDIKEKDQTLSALPATMALYNALKNGFVCDDVTTTHLSTYQKQGVAVFKSWNEIVVKT